jgi:hypothetical protein
MGEHHVTIKAETGVTCLLANECQRWLVNHQKKRRAWSSFFLIGGTNSGLVFFRTVR